MESEVKKVVFLIILLILIVGCSATAESSDGSNDERFNVISSYGYNTYKILKDNQTGCKYLKYIGTQNSVITPLLKSDGTPDCE